MLTLILITFTLLTTTSAILFHPTNFISNITFCSPYDLKWRNATENGNVTIVFWYQPPSSNPLAPQWNDVRLGSTQESHFLWTPSYAAGAILDDIPGKIINSTTKCYFELRPEGPAITPGEESAFSRHFSIRNPLEWDGTLPEPHNCKPTPSKSKPSPHDEPTVYPTLLPSSPETDDAESKIRNTASGGIIGILLLAGLALFV